MVELLKIVVEAFGYLASGLVILSQSMRTLVRLRVASLAASLCFLIYGVSLQVWPVVALHALLLPLNAWRLKEILDIQRKVRAATAGDEAFAWLARISDRRRHVAGDVLYRVGEEAAELYVILSGTFRQIETGEYLGAGQVVGERALVAPDMRRQKTLVCVEPGEVVALSYAQWRVMFYENPRFGFYFLGLIASRLFDDIARLERAVETRDRDLRGFAQSPTLRPTRAPPGSSGFIPRS